MKKNLPILVIIALLSLVSCTKSTDKFVPYANAELNDVNWSAAGVDDAKARQIITMLSKPDFSTTFNVLNGATIDVSNSLQISLPASSYIINGSSYTSGNVFFTIKQLLNKGDFIRNLIPSSGNNPIQETKGSFLIGLADANKNNLSFSQNSTYNLRLIDSPTSNEYKFFSGSIAAFSEGGVLWNLADSADNGYLQINSVVAQGVYKSAYEISCKKLSWINIAKPLAQSTNLADLNVVLPQNFTNKTTFVFAVFNDKNIVMQLTSDFANKIHILKNLPIGSNIKLVSISMIDGQLYLGKQDVVVTKTIQLALKPSTVPITASDLSAFLDGL